MRYRNLTLPSAASAPPRRNLTAGSGNAMTNVMTYKGYVAGVTADAEDKVTVG